jgi:hypothetical protein
MVNLYAGITSIIPRNATSVKEITLSFKEFKENTGVFGKNENLAHSLLSPERRNCALRISKNSFR